MTRRWVVGLVAVGIVVLAALAVGPPGRGGPPLDPGSTAGNGTRALVDLGRSMGRTVEVAAAPGQADVVLVLVDRLSGEERRRLSTFVREGGRLVVADPSSPLADVDVVGGALTDGVGPVRRAPDCDLEAVAGVERVAASAWTSLDDVPGWTGCFQVGDGHWLQRRSAGQGEVIVLGSAQVLTNDWLGEADNPVFVAALLYPTGDLRLHVVPLPTPGQGDADLADLVPTRVVHAVIAGALVFVVVAVWRGRRLGRPVSEELPVRVPGGELGTALAELLHRTENVQGAAGMLRDELRRDVATAVGAPPDADLAALRDVLVRRTALTPDVVETALSPRPTAGDAGLLGVARAVAAVRAALRAGRHEYPPPTPERTP